MGLTESCVGMMQSERVTAESSSVLFWNTVDRMLESPQASLSFFLLGFQLTGPSTLVIVVML